MNSVPLLRNSERTDFKRCPQRWQWRWNENLVPIEFTHGPLVFGTLGHLALAQWYIPGTKRGRHPAETWDEIAKDLMDGLFSETTSYIDEELEMGWLEAKQLGHDLLVNYVNEYGDDDAWEVLWVEHPGKQLIPHPYYALAKEMGGTISAKPTPIVNYCYTMDLIIRDHTANGRIRYVDHKFMKAIQTRHLWIDSQNGGYLAIGTHELRKAGLIGPKEAVRDLIYNFVRKARPPDKPRNAFGEYLNKDGTPMKRQPPPYFDRVVITKTAKERNAQITHIGNEALAMKAFRTGKLPLYKTPTRDCAWDCSFFNLCQVHETGGDVEETKRMLFKKEDPYSEYYDENPTVTKRLREE